ncbi:hypothetical protein QBE52_10290 [Clostridiaceae bacterium 35-E11]
MYTLNNMQSLLYGQNKFAKFFLNSSNGLSYFMDSKKTSISLFDEKILEFDIDIDPFGNIGVVILSNHGQLYYYFLNGNTWSKSLLYQLDVNTEIMKDISIKFTNHSPYILCRWKDIDNSNLWSIISYYKHNDCWQNEKITDIRFLYAEDTKPYFLIRDFNFNLYLIYLTNSNIIYDLNMKTLSDQSLQWGNQLFLSNCIYLKFFHLDVLVDTYGGIHINWIDKNKNKHCIQYLYIPKTKYKSSTPVTLLESIEPFTSNHLFIENHRMTCYGITDRHIYYTIKLPQNITDASKWHHYQELGLEPHAVHMFKNVYHPDNPLIDYQANCILTTDLSSYLPIHYSKVNTTTDHPLSKKAPEDSTSISKPKDEFEIDALKELYYELLEKKQALDSKENLLKALENQISSLNEELSKMSIDYTTVSLQNHSLEDMKNNLQVHSSEYKQKHKDNLDDQLQDFIKTVEEIQTNYSSINQSLANINQKQIENKEKIEDLLQQYSIFSEHLQQMNTSPLFKLLNFFK